VLAFGFFAQSAGAISISPSPSYDGNYTVYHAQLGCNSYWDEFGAQWDVCYYLTEGTNGSPSGSWSSGSSHYFSGKAEATYSYTTTAHYYSYMWGVDTWQVVEGPAYVEVDLPPPFPDATVAPVGFGPTYYRLEWSATNATSCELDIIWINSNGVWLDRYTPTVGTSGGYNIYPRTNPYVSPSNTDHVSAKVTCYGNGTSDYQHWPNLSF